MGDLNSFGTRRFTSTVFRLIWCSSLCWWAVFVHNHQPVQTYRSPDEYHFSIGKEENLYDTGTLPEGENVGVYLFHDEPQSYFLPTDGQSSPVSITVVPCSAVIDWKVYYHPQESYQKHDGIDGDPLFLEESTSVSQIDVRQSRSEASPLYAIESDNMTTFKTTSHLSKGIIRLVLTSKKSNSRVEIYATSSRDRQTEAAVPLLPEDARIEIAANDRHSVTVAWKQSPSHKQWGQHIQYCVTFNPRHHYRTLCAVHADLEGEAPPVWPRHAGFGFRWEDTVKKRLSVLRQQYLADGGRNVRRDIHFECVGSRHWASVTSLFSNRRYYVDVFAVNTLSNRSTAYSGTVLTTPASSTPSPMLKSGRLTTAQVGGSIGPQVSYDLRLAKFTKKLVLFVQTCSRIVTVDFIYEGAVVIGPVPVGDRGLRKLVLKNAEPGNYSVRINRNSEDTLQVPVRLCIFTGAGSASGKSRKCPYNGIPHNRMMNATKNLASCRSVTLQWPAADVHAKYCLYVTRVHHGLGNDDMYLQDEEHGCNSDSQSAGHNADAADGNVNVNVDTEKPIFCRGYRRSSPQRNGKSIVETVWDLKMKTKYRFRLQAVLRKGVTVNYDPLFMDMKDKC